MIVYTEHKNNYPYRIIESYVNCPYVWCIDISNYDNEDEGGTSFKFLLKRYSE